MAVTDYVATQLDNAALMRGASIVRWEATEMAIQEDRDGGTPVFSHPAARCLQLVRLVIHMQQGPMVFVSNYQNDDVFGLRPAWRDTSPVRQPPVDGIFRDRVLTELPAGPVRSVRARLSVDTNDLVELVLDVAGHELLLVAGEIYETSTERLEWAWCDESTLVFSNPTDVGDIDWTSPREYHEIQLP